MLAFEQLGAEEPTSRQQQPALHRAFAAGKREALRKK